MRFTLNAFVFSTVALLSLMTPVVNAYVAKITKPTTGQTLQVYSSIEVTWTILNKKGLGNVNCEIALVHADQDPSIPISPGILQTGIHILNGQSNGPVKIPNVEPRDDYYLELLSADGATVLGQSGTFTID